MSIEVGFLELTNGKCPYLDWKQKLDKTVRGAVRIRINRLRLGNFGDCKTIQGVTGLYGLRIHIGAGYRLYFGKAKDHLVIVLCGGDNAPKNATLRRQKNTGDFIRVA